ncbi:MAG TPA: glycerophosphodiester phosphodiesterase family protein [bacterium]|nr:glycerophosphodiester phosphodiesterase family protein [bacterium]
MKTVPQIIAHRGASAEAPENTLAAYRRALAIGVHGVELDVNLSADREPMVIHDHVLDRTTDGHGPVGTRTLVELRRLDAGRWFGEAFAGERLLTLAEALDVLRAVRVIVEIKAGLGRTPGIADRVAAVIRASTHRAVTVSSFDHPLLVEVKAALPEIDIAVLYTARPIHALRLAQDAGAGYLHPYWFWLTPDVVTAAHAAGLYVETWVVDEPADQSRVLGMEVDGVMTNHPPRLRQTFAALQLPLPPSR